MVTYFQNCSARGGQCVKGICMCKPYFFFNSLSHFNSSQWFKQFFKVYVLVRFYLNCRT